MTTTRNQALCRSGRHALWVALLLCCLPLDASAAVRKGPYLIYPGQNTRMTVLWQLDQTRPCTLAWGTNTSYTLGATATSEYGTDHQHAFTITNLLPGLRHYYRVTEDGTNFNGSFLTAPSETATNLCLFVLGDSRSEPDRFSAVCQQIVDELGSDPDCRTLALHSGDSVGLDLETDWQNHYFNRSFQPILDLQAHLPVQMCMGNHEGAGIGFTKYLPYPFVTNRYWSFDYGPLHVTVLDQYNDYAPGSAQYAWMTNDMATSAKPWHFVLFHEPGYGAGLHPNNTSVQNYVHPTCASNDVCMAFAGHNHNYVHALKDDVHHITSGGAGAPLYDVNTNYPFVLTAVKQHHYCRVEIQGDTLTFTALNTNDVVIDSFAITNHSTPTCTLTVTSPHGACSPTAAVHPMPSNTVLACSVLDSPVTEGATQYVCRGFVGSGSAPPGDDTTVTDLFTLTNDSTVTWLWSTNFWLDTEVVDEGTVAPADTWLPAGTQCVLQANPAEYYRFDRWEGDVTGSTNPTDIVMTRAKTATAWFGPILLTNQVPQWWLALYGLGTNDADALLDSDGDSVTNWQEYVGGSDPTNTASVLALAGHTAMDLFVLTWSSLSGRLYAVSRTTNLLTGFEPLATHLPATPPQNSYTDNVSPQGHAFYSINATLE